MGPSGNRIVFSCLPLFCLPDQLNNGSSNSVNHQLNPQPPLSSSAPKNDGWISFTQSVKRPVLKSDSQVPTNTDPDILPPVDAELPGDLFTIVDPFEEQQAEGFGGFETSTRGNLIDDAFEKATKTIGTNEEDKGGFSDSDDNAMNDDSDGGKDIQINYVSDVNTVNKSRTASVSFMSMNQVSRSNTLVPTSLPPAPRTIFPRYTERGGWLIKLSHQKGTYKV